MAATIEKIIVNVEVRQITTFWRKNHYTRQSELVSCISMSEPGGNPEDSWFVTFTSGSFADVEVGDRFTMSCKFKRFQEYGGRSQTVVNYCKKMT